MTKPRARRYLSGMRGLFWSVSAALVAGALAVQAQISAGIEIHTNSAGEETVSAGLVLDDSGLLVTVAPSVEPKTTFAYLTSLGPKEATVALFDSVSRLLLLKPSEPGEFAVTPMATETPAPASILRWEGEKGEQQVAFAGLVAQVKGQPLPLTHWAVLFAPDDDPAPGTPLWTAEGKVAALVLGPLPDGEPAWLCLPVAAARKVLTDFREAGKADTSQLELGIAIGTSLPRVEFVREGSRAAQAGVQAGDVILEISQRPIRQVLDILDANFYLTSRQPVELRVLRGGKTWMLIAPPLKGEAASEKKGD